MARQIKGSSRETLAIKMALLSSQHGREKREAAEATRHAAQRRAEEAQLRQERNAAAARHRRQREELERFFASTVMPQIEETARRSYDKTTITLKGNRWVYRDTTGDDAPVWVPTDQTNELLEMLRHNGFTVRSDIDFQESSLSYSVKGIVVLSVSWTNDLLLDSSDEHDPADPSDEIEGPLPLEGKAERRPGLSIGRLFGELMTSLLGMIAYGVFLLLIIGFFIFQLGSCLESCLDNGRHRSSLLFSPSGAGHLSQVDQIRTKT